MDLPTTGEATMRKTTAQVIQEAREIAAPAMAKTGRPVSAKEMRKLDPAAADRLAAHIRANKDVIVKAIADRL